MSKRFVSVALLLFAISSSAFAGPRRDNSDRPERGLLDRIVQRVVHLLDTMTWPKP